ncbi:helix-turn-helix domain-containing protein [Nocardioides panacisoli]|uniref:PucR family transcriptional regulator n=1 Tax=Nocardioides panacisoli TaxID=627624 RepID=UPI001C62D72B|nr:helix-turn-helix domain-containing protein [Nocardioides panacisoli]QYJ03648.1 helix-turn-helix domain-containing protein [Nocardioides panacisoli]
MPPSPPADATLAAHVDRHRATRLDPLTDRLVEMIERANPGYRRSGLVPREDLWHSCHTNIDRILELLSRALDPAREATEPGTPMLPDDAVEYDAARATGKRRSDQGLPLDDVLRSFRMGGRIIWDDLLAEAPDMGVEALREVGTQLWEIVDATSAQVARSYHQAEREHVRADEQLRVRLWEGVLGGRGVEPGFAHEAGRTLQLPPEDPMVVVVAPVVDLDLARHVLSGHHMAWTSRSGDVVGLVVPGEGDASATYDALERLAVRSGLVGVSMPVDGLALAHVGLHQATLALRAATPDAGLARFDAHLPEALLFSAPDIAAHLVGVWLDPVLALPHAEAQVLLDTVRGWVATSGSATRTGELVHCHRNTVLNRLRRVEEVTGRVLGEAPPMELDLALRALGQRAQTFDAHGGRAGSGVAE